MRFLAVLIALIFAPASYAQDEFGPRFSNEAPTALGNYEVADMDLMAEGLQDIMPAGGDEEPVTNTPTDTQPTTTEIGTQTEIQPVE